jgi:ATP-binding cassette subfamily B multidrug efflux pump
MSDERKDYRPTGGVPAGGGRQPGGMMRPGGFGGGHAAFGAPGAKAKDFKGTLKRLLTYLRPYQTQFTIVLIFAVLSTTFSILSPKIMGWATTRLLNGLIGKFMAYRLHQPAPSIDFAYIGNIILGLIGLYLFSAAFSFVQQYTMAGVAQKTVYNMRRDLNDKLARLPLKYFDSRTHGEIMSRMTNDIDTISMGLQQSMTQLITSVCTIIGVLIMMLTISPMLTLITVVTLPLSFIGVTAITKRSQKYFAGQQKELGELNGHVEEMFTGHKIVKAFRHEERSIGQFTEVNDRLYNVGWRAQFVSGILFPMMNFINNIGYVLICVMGGIYVTKNVIELGDVQAFIQYSRQFSQPIAQTANIANVLQSLVASAERVFEVLDEKEEIPDRADAVTLPEPQGEVRFQHVTFGYKEGDTLMDNLNIDHRYRWSHRRRKNHPG